MMLLRCKRYGQLVTVQLLVVTLDQGDQVSSHKVCL